MGTYRLDRLFAPRSVALVGASPRGTSVGRTVLENLRAAGFEGSVHLVNPHYAEIASIGAVKSVADLPIAPDITIIAAPPPAVPDIIAAAGAKGCPAAIIVTAGLGHGSGSLAEAAARAARAHGVRLVGPNCLGILVPPIKLNASFAARMPQVGDLALISQSGAIAAGLVEWAAKRSVGLPPVNPLGRISEFSLAGFAGIDNPRLKQESSHADPERSSEPLFPAAGRRGATPIPGGLARPGRHDRDDGRLNAISPKCRDLRRE